VPTVVSNDTALEMEVSRHVQEHPRALISVDVEIRHDCFVNRLPTWRVACKTNELHAMRGIVIKSSKINIGSQARSLEPKARVLSASRYVSITAEYNNEVSVVLRF
jgi:hypothetical protein